MHHRKEDAARPGSRGGEGSNQQRNNTTLAPHRASPRATLTPAQRGRFSTNVGEAIEAARAGAAGGGAK